MNTAVAKLRLTLRRPSLAAERFTRKVDNRVRIVHDRRQRGGCRSVLASIGRPSHARDAGHTGAGLVPCLAGRKAAREHANVMTFLRIDLRQRTAEKSRPAGDDDLHAEIGRI